MAWLGKVSLGGFPDLAEAVTKLSESVKNIEKNFDSALGLEEKPDSGEASGIWPSASDRKALFDPVMAFMGQKGGDSSVTEPSEKEESLEHKSAVEHVKFPAEGPSLSASETVVPYEKENEAFESRGEGTGSQDMDIMSDADADHVEDKAEAESNLSQAESGFAFDGKLESVDSTQSLEQKEDADVGTNDQYSSESGPVGTVEQTVSTKPLTQLHLASDSRGSQNEGKATESFVEKGYPEHVNVLDCNRKLNLETGISDSIPIGMLKEGSSKDHSADHLENSAENVVRTASELENHDIDSSMKPVEVDSQSRGLETDGEERSMNSGFNMPDSESVTFELEKVKREMKQMEAALQGAARQAQAKADEISKMMIENEQLKSAIEDLKRKSTEANSDALREEYHQRVSSLERKVYALTRERDTLRREQNKRSDAAALLKEKDEIINQVMAEGEELSKKQAAQESTIRKLRAQIREFEEEKQRLNSKLQVEETKADSIKRDKAATEKLLQETIERNQAELASQKEFYTNALNAAKEAEALAEARAGNEAKIELESRLKEAGEREAMLVQALEELRQTLSRTEQQASFREDMLRRDVDDLQKRYQASELRYNELITQVPESTRPLLRQIEAMQEAAARKVEAWEGVERNLNSRLEAAEANAAAAEERERSMNYRLSQTLSRMTVLETQIACLRAEHTQLSRSLEKERQRASESRQEILAAMEEAATHEGRAKQLEDEIREFRSKHKQEMQVEVARRELIEKELERERAAKSELERTAHLETTVISDHAPASKHPKLYVENGNVPIRKLSSAGSISSMEESFFLQASLDSSDSGFSERRAPGETISPYFLKSMTPSTFEATLRQKDGELASYISRLASLESIRDSLAEELVKMTEQCEKLRAEADMLPGIRAELEALRRRHSSALELMGERDEELEELRADIIDMKEMYREQVDLLVNKIQMLSSVGTG